MGRIANNNGLSRKGALCGTHKTLKLWILFSS
uniref:Uncharacterized protein n=1 Tax=Rhizophora mucronata TaxID=61149 RepID=A0A2P2QMR9_RHIMU